MARLREALTRLWTRLRARTGATPFARVRGRLVAINLAVVSAIVLVMALAVYLTDTHAIDQQIDQQLIAAASRETPLRVLQEQSGTSGHESADPGERYEPSTPNVFIVVLDASGHPTIDVGQVGALVSPTTMRRHLNGYVTVVQGGHTYRLYLVPVSQNGQLIGVLQVGMSLDARDRQLHDLVLTLILVGSGVLVLTALASVYLAERALEPARLAFERQRQFSAAASHELRTPLAIARSQAELVARRLRRAGERSDRPPASLGADIEEVIAEIDYMTRLVADLTLLARTGAAQGERPTQIVDLGAIAAETVAKMQAAAAERDLTLTLAPPDTGAPPALVPGDADRLRQLIIILVENALRYTPSGGAIAIGVGVTTGPRFIPGRHGHARVSVSDTGIGIAPGDIDRIFEPFFRGDPARASDDDEHTGSGLGLALAEWITRTHDGTLSVASTVGQGSTFAVELPLARGAVDAALPPLTPSTRADPPAARAKPRTNKTGTRR